MEKSRKLEEVTTVYIYGLTDPRDSSVFKLRELGHSLSAGTVSKILRDKGIR